MASIEEKVEEHYKKILDSSGIRHYGKTEKMNPVIAEALKKKINDIALAERERQ